MVIADIAAYSPGFRRPWQTSSRTPSRSSCGLGCAVAGAGGLLASVAGWYAGSAAASTLWCHLCRVEGQHSSDVGQLLQTFIDWHASRICCDMRIVGHRCGTQIVRL